MTAPSVRRQVFGGHVAVCPHCGSDHEPIYTCRIVSGFNTCVSCHRRFQESAFVPEGSWLDPQRWRSEEPLQRVQAVFPQIVRLETDGIWGPKWSPDRSYVILFGRLAPTGPRGVSGFFPLKAILPGDDPVFSRPDPQELLSH